MRIQRVVSMNPVEPEPMSLRAPANMRLLIDLQYLDLAGRPLTDDLAAQLQLTSRTNDTTVSYPAPAIDIVNGKARVTIGQDDLTDMNGYRLRLMGTYRGEPALFAIGVLRLTDAAGIDATPEDVIDDVPIDLAYNFDASINIRLWQDAGKGTPFDLTTATISSSVYASSSDSTVLATFTATPTTLPGEVILSLTAAIVNTLPPGCWWSLMASTAGGVTTLAQGTVTITGVQGYVA
jgi:hypothetical protein